MNFNELDFIEKILVYEDNVEINLTRILILLNIFSQSNSKELFRGLTKLVKLDFLLRYPINLERAVNFNRKRKIDCYIKEYEKYNVESKMIRYLYGPWDPKYRNYINILVAKKLISIKKIGKTFIINLTEKGLEVSNTLIEIPDLEDYKNRSLILYNEFKDYSSTKIKNYIYKVFPEITSLDIGDEIIYEHKIEDPYIIL